MRNYQPKKNNPYLLPYNLYRRVLYTIRDYPRLCEEASIRSDYLTAFTVDGMPKATAHSSPTEFAAIHLSLITDEIRAIDKAIASIPKFYRKPVLENIISDKAYPVYGADRRTYGTYKQRFIYNVAKNLNLA